MEMFRSLLPAILTAAIIPAVSVAAPAVAVPSHRSLDRIGYQAYRIQAEADGLQGYVRSGAHDRLSTYAYARAMGHSLNRLSKLIDKVAAEPGENAQTRMQVAKLKLQAAALNAVVSDTVAKLNPNTLELNASTIFNDTDNIESRGSAIQNTIENLAHTS